MRSLEALQAELNQVYAICLTYQWFRKYKRDKNNCRLNRILNG